jgi:hypothetical protein
VTIKVRACFPASLWMPWPSSQEGNTVAHHRAAAPAAGDAGLRARLGKLFLQVPPPSLPHVQPRLLSFFVSFPHISRPGHRDAVAVLVSAVDVTSACAHARPRAHPRARALAHTCTLLGRQGRAFGSAPLHRTLLTRSQCRCGLCHVGCLSTRASTG